MKVANRRPHWLTISNKRVYTEYCVSRYGVGTASMDMYCFEASRHSKTEDRNDHKHVCSQTSVVVQSCRLPLSTFDHQK